MNTNEENSMTQIHQKYESDVIMQEFDNIRLSYQLNCSVPYWKISHAEDIDMNQFHMAIRRGED